MAAWKSTIALSVVLALIALNAGCGNKKQESAEQENDMAFLLGTEGTIRNTQLLIEGKAHEVAIVTLSLGIENMSSEVIEVDISSNIQLIHPLAETKRDLFKLLKAKKGPYIVHVKPKDRQFRALEFVQKPGSPPLMDHILVSVPSGPYIQKVKLKRDTK